MTTLPTGPGGRLVALGATVLLLAVLWIGIASPLLAWYADAAETLQQRTALARRMAEIAETLPQLRRQAATAGAAAPAASALLPGGSDAVAGAKLQELVQAMAQGVGIGLNRTEMLPMEARGAYARVGLRAAFAADWPALIALLQAIDGASPRMLVDELQLRGPGQRVGGGDAKIDVTLSVLAFRSAKAGADGQ